MAAQGEWVLGVVGVCSDDFEPMARDGTPLYNYSPRGSSTPYSEHGLGRQMEPHNGGAIAPRRGTEQAAINSAANGTTRGEHSQQPPLQTTWLWQVKQADIDRLQKQLEEEWKNKTEEERRKYRLELEQLMSGVGRGNRDRKSLEEKVKKRTGRSETIERSQSKVGVCGDEDGIRKKSF